MSEDRTAHGDPHSRARLAAIFGFTVRWYSALAVLFALVVGLGGYFFLAGKGASTIDWHWPWIALVPIVALQLFLLPFQSILEGCNQIGRISFIRLVASIAASLGLWAGLYFHLGLWAMWLSFFMNCLCQLALGLYYYFPFYRSLARESDTGVFSWKNEALPLQWRLAVAGVFGYFSTSYFVPIIFWYHGAKMAGQMGMGWQIMVAAQSIALTWVYANTPTFGALIAKKEYAKLDHLFGRVLIISVGALIALSAGAWGLIKLLDLQGNRFADRCMTSGQLLLFLLAAVFMQLPQCQSVYLRAHKKEPLLLSSVISSVVTGVLAWWFGKQYGITGIGITYVFTVTFVVLPMVSVIWFRRRQEWHA